MSAKIPFLWYFTKEINFNLNQFNILSCIYFNTFTL
jgi:hypothetical protein